MIHETGSTDLSCRHRNDPVRRNRGHDGGGKPAGHRYGLSRVLHLGKVVGRRKCVVLQHRKVKSVVVVRIREIAHGETGAHDRTVGHAIGNAKARREILVVGLPPQVKRVAADAGNHQAVSVGIIVRESARSLRGKGWVELPAQARA